MADEVVLGIGVVLNQDITGPAKEAAAGISALNKEFSDAVANMSSKKINLELDKTNEEMSRLTDQWLKLINEENTDMAALDALDAKMDALIAKDTILFNAWADNITGRMNSHKILMGESEEESASSEKIAASVSKVAVEATKAAESVSKITVATAEIPQSVDVAKASVTQLSTSMSLVSQVAKEYGISASEASRLIKEQAQEAGVSVQNYAQNLMTAAEEAKGLFQFSPISDATRNPFTIWAEDARVAWEAIVDYESKIEATTASSVVAMAQYQNEVAQRWEQNLQRRQNIMNQSVVDEGQYIVRIQQMWEQFAQNSITFPRQLVTEPSEDKSLADRLLLMRAEKEAYAELIATAASYLPALKSVGASEAEMTALMQTQGVARKDAEQAVRSFINTLAAEKEAELTDAEATRILAETHDRLTLAYEKAGEAKKQSQVDNTNVTSQGVLSGSRETIGEQDARIDQLVADAQARIGTTASTAAEEESRLNAEFLQAAKNYSNVAKYATDYNNLSEKQNALLDQLSERMNRAESNLLNFAKSQGVAAENTIASNGALEASQQAWQGWEKTATSGIKVTADYERVIKAYTQAGYSSAEATNMVNEAEKKGLDTKQMLNEADTLRQKAIRQLMSEGNSLAESQHLVAFSSDEEAAAANRAAKAMHGQEEAQVNSFAAMRAGRLAIAGLLADMALMNIAAGEQLPAALRESVKGIQTVVDTATAGAFAFEAFGIGTVGAGLAIGAVAGFLEVLISKLATGSAEVGNLNKELDTMAHKVDVATTLKELTGWTDEYTKSVLEAAAKSPELAKALQTVADNAEHTRNAIDMINSGMASSDSAVSHFDDILGKLGKTLSDAATAAGQLGNILIGLTFFSESYIGALEHGKNEQEAFSAGFKSMHDVMLGSAEDLRKVTDAQVTLNAEMAKNNVANQFKQVSDALANLSIKDKATELGELANTSSRAADAFYQFAATHAEVGAQANALTTKITEEREAIAALQVQLDAHPYDVKIQSDLRQTQTELDSNTKSLTDLVMANQKAAASANQLAEAQHTLDNALADADQRMAQLTERTNTQYAQAQQQYLDSRADAIRTFGEAEINAEQTKDNKLADIAQQYANRVEDIQTQLANKLADIQVQLGNKIADAQQALSDKESELAHSYQNKLDQINQQIVDAAQQASDKLYDIERTREESLAALGFSTHEQLEGAKTDHDRAKILEKSQFEAGQINQRANDQTADTQRALAETEKKYQKERELAAREYEYEKQLAIRQEQETIARAEREAAQQTAVAQREAAQQMAIAQRTADQATATAMREFNQQVAAAQRAEADKLANAERSLKEKDAQIAASFKLEQQAIEYAKEKAQQDHDFRIGLLQQEEKVVIGLAAAYVGLGNAFRTLIATAGGSIGVGGGSGIGTGGGIGGRPPVGTGGGVGSGNNINIHINGNQSPHAIANEIRKVLSRESMRNAGAYA